MMSRLSAEPDDEISSGLVVHPVVRIRSKPEAKAFGSDGVGSLKASQLRMYWSDMAELPMETAGGVACLAKLLEFHQLEPEPELVVVGCNEYQANKHKPIGSSSRLSVFEWQSGLATLSCARTCAVEAVIATTAASAMFKRGTLVQSKAEELRWD